MAGQLGVDTEVVEAAHVQVPGWVREEFEVCRRMSYLDVAGRAPMAGRVHRALTEFLGDCRTEGARKDRWLTEIAEIRTRAASFIGADPEEVAFMKNTSDGLNSIALALELQAGDNVVVSPAFEHANNVYPWLHLSDRGIETRIVPMAEGRVDPAEVAKLIDDRTRVVTVSVVSAWTGARTDLPALAELCRPRGIFLLADGAQSLGVIDTDVRALGVDALAGATQKGLLAMYGLGLLYVRSEWLPRLRPPFLSVSSAAREGIHDSAPVTSYQVRTDAAKFETGNPNFAGMLGFGASLSLLEEVGPQLVERRVTGLVTMMIDELRARGIEVATPRPAQEHAGIVAFSPEDAPGAWRHLEDNGVRLSLRRGQLRAGLHIYNNEDDIARLLTHLDDYTPA